MVEWRWWCLVRGVVWCGVVCKGWCGGGGGGGGGGSDTCVTNMSLSI